MAEEHISDEDSFETSDQEDSYEEEEIDRESDDLAEDYYEEELTNDEEESEVTDESDEDSGQAVTVEGGECDDEDVMDEDNGDDEELSKDDSIGEEEIDEVSNHDDEEGEDVEDEEVELSEKEELCEVSGDEERKSEENDDEKFSSESDEEEVDSEEKGLDEEDRENINAVEDEKNREEVRNDKIIIDRYVASHIIEETSALVTVATVKHVGVLDSGNADFILFRLNSFVKQHLRKIFLLFGGIGEKVKRKGVLRNKKRREMYEYILSHPGSHFREILRTIKASSNEGVWHLRMLEMAGLVKKERFGRYLIYYPNGIGNKSDILDWNFKFILKGEKCFRIAKTIKENRCIKIKELAEKLSMPPNTIRYYINKLERFGLIKKINCNGAAEIFLEPKLESLIENLES